MKDQVDYIVSKFQEAMGKINAFDARLESVVLSVSTLMQNLDALSKNHKKLEDFSKESNQVIGAALHSDKISFQKNDLQLNWLETSFKTLEEDFKQMVSNMPEILGQVSKIKKDLTGFASIELVNNIKKDFVNLETYVKARHQDFHEKLIDIQNKHNNLKDLSSSQSADLSNFVKNFKELQAKFNNLAGDLGLSKSYTDSQVNHCEIVVKKYIDSVVESLPKPIIPSIDEVKNHAEKKIEPALLDSRNANIRSENSEKKIFILEKKVEQLQLILNKLQLG